MRAATITRPAPPRETLGPRADAERCAGRIAARLASPLKPAQAITQAEDGLPLFDTARSPIML